MLESEYYGRNLSVQMEGNVLKNFCVQQHIKPTYV